MNVDTLYENLCQEKSDINEHLPDLKYYAEQCDTIVEMGVRSVVSSFAFIKAKPKKMISIDIFHPSYFGQQERVDIITKYAVDNGINYEFIVADSRRVNIEESDLLFIDTLHAYPQLKEELEKHANKIQKYLIFHDTTLYEFSDEQNCYTNKRLSGVKQGLWPAIEEFLFSNPNWVLLQRKTNNNGLTILKRNENTKK